MPNELDNGKLEHTANEQQYLLLRGLKAVVSSNVSAIGRDEIGLIVRFHGGSTYRYPESGDLYDDMLKAPSKGKFVWNELRRKNVPYYRIGAVSIDKDVESRDMMMPPTEGFMETPDTVVTLDTVRTKLNIKKPVMEKPEGLKAPKGMTVAAAIALGLVVKPEMVAGLVLAKQINDSRQA